MLTGKDLLAPFKQLKDRRNLLHLGRRAPSGVAGPSNAGHQSSALNVELPPLPRQGSSQPTKALPPFTSVAPDASAFSNQARELPSHADGEPCSVELEEKASFLSNLRFFSEAALEVADEFSEPFPPLNLAIKGLLVALKGFENVDCVQDDFVYAAQKLTIMKSTYNNHCRELNAAERIEPCLEALARTIEMVEKTVRAKSDRGILKRIWEYPSDLKVLSNALRMLGDVADHFVMNVTASTHAMLQDHIDSTVLDKLTFVESAHFQSVDTGRLCTEGTRTEFLTNLISWGTASSGVPMICLVNGPAGSGKSTIAYTVCSFLQKLDLLGGSFFCSRDNDDKRGSTRFIFSTLARSLASHDRDYASALIQVVRKAIGVGTFVAKDQLKNLIVGPMRDRHFAQQTQVAPVRVFVIDALDECADDDRTLYEIMCTLLAESHNMPVKFLITSRPESRITQAFTEKLRNRYVRYRVEDVPENVARDDILIYLRSELNLCAQACQVPDGWPPVAQVEALAKQAGTLFIYASTACKYIWNLDDDAPQRLNDLTALNPQRLSSIDLMYEFVLARVRQSKSDATWEMTCHCLHTIVHLRRPLSLVDFAALMDVSPRQLRIALSGLQSIVNIPSCDYPDLVSVFHSSFPEYLRDTNRTHGKAWSMDSTIMHAGVLQRCLSIMEEELRFNISNSCTSYASNLDQRTQHSVSGALHYACLHWIDHLERCGSLSTADINDLGKLLYRRFLYWVDVLSVTSSVQAGPFVMTRLLTWIATHSGHSLALSNNVSGSDIPAYDLRKFATDARRFITIFAVPIKISSPHIYLSALAAASRESEVWSELPYSFNKMPRLITLQRPNIYSSSVLRGHEEGINAVAFSSNCARIVSGSDDQNIRLWDIATGEVVGEPLRGHEDSVWCVAFSADATRIVSGSDDQTVRLWDVATGAAIGEPLRGHEDSVVSVAFSPDGKSIVSGSRDKTICFWNLATGAAMGEPLRGHTDCVWSVAFSPDGTRIVSGSWDETICLWDVVTGAPIGEPLRGHEGWVLSVAFSPDGTRIVSGSSDGTIRLWDAATREAIKEPLCGHEDSVASVEFSTDGTRIVSGSLDKTIRMWDVVTGAAIGDPLRGHEDSVSSVHISSDGARIVSASKDETICLWDVVVEAVTSKPLPSHCEPIRSVAFSPDGTRIVSGARDNTVRLWDVATGAAVGEPLLGHEGFVSSVAFSFNGTRIVSGSWDGTIRMWDVASGKAIGKPLLGHEGLVLSVAFSPDSARIVSGSDDQTVRVWDVGTGAVIGEPLRGHKSRVSSVSISPDGTRIVSGSADKTIRLWDVATRTAISEPMLGHEKSVSSVRFSPDGELIVSGSFDQTIRLWDVATGAVIGEPLRGHTDWVLSVAFSPDGTRIVSSSGADDQTIRLWDVATGVGIGEPLRGHQHAIPSVAFSPDGTRVVSGSHDQTIRVWDVSNGDVIGESLLSNEGSIGSLAVSPNGTRNASPSSSGHLQSLNVNSTLTGHSSPRHTDEPIVNIAPHTGHSSPMQPSHAHIQPSSCIPANRVAFSREHEHSTCIDDILMPGRDPRDSMTLDQDGWLRGPKGELFLWIPPEYRLGLWSPRTTAIMGAHPLMLDLSRFVRGTDWTKCFSPEACDVQQERTRAPSKSSQVSPDSTSNHAIQMRPGSDLLITRSGIRLLTILRLALSYVMLWIQFLFR